MIDSIEWRVSPGLADYATALAEMEQRAADIRAGTASELVWLLEHPPLYTAGTSADPAELLSAERFPVFKIGRGGRYTYHGPGQRVGYVLLDLERRGRDVRCFVHSLEAWLISALATKGISARRESGRVGIWTGEGADEAKIAAIGVRVRRWVTFHGFAINIDPDLTHFGGIVPCGIADYGVTSLAKLGLVTGETAMLDNTLAATFPDFLNKLNGCAFA
jgi:lipoyl(octanoyl) transferase